MNRSGRLDYWLDDMTLVLLAATRPLLTGTRWALAALGAGSAGAWPMTTTETERVGGRVIFWCRTCPMIANMSGGTAEDRRKAYETIAAGHEGHDVAPAYAWWPLRVWIRLEALRRRRAAR